MNQSARAVYFFSFLLAFCSLFYELAFAQVLSVCLGGTKTQYVTTVAIFTCALGFGSLSFPKASLRLGPRAVLLRIELLLMTLGALGPFLVTAILRPSDSGAISVLGLCLSYGLVFAVGFLSGFELPALFAMRPGAEGKILAMDYLGMLAASVTFPLLFLPNLGTGASVVFVALLNGAALIWLAGKKWPVIPLSLSAVGVVLYARAIDDALGFLYLGGAP